MEEGKAVTEAEEGSVDVPEGGPQGADGKGSKKWYWGPLLIVVLTQFIIVIDSTMMNVSISALVKDLNTDITTIQGIIAGYTLIMASLLLLGARMGDVFGRRKAFVAALIIYTAGTTMAALSTTPGMLFFGWSFLEGVGAAVMLPATLAIINTEYKGRDKALAFGAWGSMAAAGAAFGPILGGFFTTYLSWRYAFGMEAIIAVALLLMTPMLQESRATMRAKQLDITGALVSAAALALVIFAVLKGQEWGWLWAADDSVALPGGLSPVPVMMAAGLVLLLVFARHERRVKDRGGTPLLDPDMFSLRVFTVGNVTDMVESIILGGMLFIIPVFLQSVVGSNAFQTGLTLLPMTVMVFVFSIGASRLGNKVSPKYLIMAGIVMSLVGTIYLRDIFGVDIGETDLLVGLTLFGIGIGLMMSQLVNVTISSAGRARSTEASGVVNTFEQFGNSLGTALIGAIVFTLVFQGIVDGMGGEDIFPPGTDEDDMARALDDWFKEFQRDNPEGVVDENVTAAAKVVDRALADAMGVAMDAMSLMLVLMLVCMFAMPYVPPIGSSREEDEEEVGDDSQAPEGEGEDGDEAS